MRGSQSGGSKVWTCGTLHCLPIFSTGLIDQEWAFAAGVAASNTVTISIDSFHDAISLERDKIRVITLWLSLVNPDPQILVSPSHYYQ